MGPPYLQTARRWLMQIVEIPVEHRITRKLAARTAPKRSRSRAKFLSEFSQASWLTARFYLKSLPGLVCQNLGLSSDFD